jgi:predicted enzyme related to lactoylglutathione lyase
MMGGNMPISAKFVHVNLVAQDWKKLAEFYQQVFGCTVVPPERNLSGQWLDDCTGVPAARIRGAHLGLPGRGSEGPTLEIFQYSPKMRREPTAANRPGFCHIAFSVDDVKAACDAVFSAGGKPFGKLVSAEVPGAGKLTVAYVTDPEGNIIELQTWSR